MKRDVKKPAPSASRLRIIGGEWRGRKLPVPHLEGLRPTGDRLRETLFNWLAPHLTGANCLDLFAGSGALGLEALSRGAASVTLIELQRDAAAQLRANCQTLGTLSTEGQRATVVETSALPWLNQYQGRGFHILFVDPPFDANLWQKILEAIELQQVAADQARIYVETPRDYPLLAPDNWSLEKRKTMGAVCAHVFVRDAPASQIAEPH